MQDQEETSAAAATGIMEPSIEAQADESCQQASDVATSLACSEAPDQAAGEDEAKASADGEPLVPHHRWESPKKPVSSWTTREVGLEGEELAALYLERRGYEVIERNWRCKFGETDIIAKDEDECVLIEVKTRLQLGEEDVIPELAVDEPKQERYRRMALTYLADHIELHSIRFDVIAISIVGEKCARLRHLVAAYSWDD